MTEDAENGGKRLKQKNDRAAVAVKIAACIAIALIALIFCTCCVYITLRLKNYFSFENKTENPANEEPLPSAKKDMVLISDGAMGEIWIPALEGVMKNEYDPEAFSSNNGIITYTKEGATSLVGIDVSNYQGEIDWKKVKDFGIEFAMIKVGYRGYVYENIKEDERFRENIEGACGAGIKVGVYFFSQALNEEEAVEEACFVIDAISGYKIDYPVVFDWEIITTGEARTDNMPVKALSACAVAFCDTVEKHGYTPMVYSNKRLALFKYDLSALKNYDFWLADYNPVPTFYYHFNMWQYSEKGNIDGIEGYVDLNLCFFDYAAR